MEHIYPVINQSLTVYTSPDDSGVGAAKVYFNRRAVMSVQLFELHGAPLMEVRPCCEDRAVVQAFQPSGWPLIFRTEKELYRWISQIARRHFRETCQDYSA